MILILRQESGRPSNPISGVDLCYTALVKQRKSAISFLFYGLRMEIWPLTMLSLSMVMVASCRCDFYSRQSGHISVPWRLVFELFGLRTEVWPCCHSLWLLFVNVFPKRWQSGHISVPRPKIKKERDLASFNLKTSRKQGAFSFLNLSAPRLRYGHSRVG